MNLALSKINLGRLVSGSAELSSLRSSAEELRIKFQIISQQLLKGLAAEQTGEIDHLIDSFPVMLEVIS